MKTEQMAKYDVFITCKSEDYPYAEEIYDFLTKNGLNVFLASKELRKLGESEYRKAISNAMQQAYHLIIFASKAEYIDSTWVYYEWDMFVNAKLKGFKPGNIITILKGIKTDDINMDLWKYESLKYASYKDSILEYVETEQSKTKKIQIEEKQKREEKERRLQEEQIQKVTTLKSELVKYSEDYQRKKSALSVDLTRIKSILSALSVTELKCPVCGSSCKVECDYCEKCGWPVSHVGAIEETKYLANNDQHRINMHRSLYKGSYEAESSVSRLTHEIEILKHNIQEKDKKLQSLQNEITDTRSRESNLRRENDKIKEKLYEKEQQFNDAVNQQPELSECIKVVSGNLKAGTISIGDIDSSYSKRNDVVIKGFNRVQLAIINILVAITTFFLTISFIHYKYVFLEIPICCAALLTTAFLSTRLSKKFLIFSTSFIVLISAIFGFCIDTSIGWLILAGGGILALIIAIFFGKNNNSQINNANENNKKNIVFLIVFSCFTSIFGSVYWIINLFNKRLWNLSKKNQPKLWIINIFLIVFQLSLLTANAYKQDNLDYWNTVYSSGLQEDSVVVVEVIDETSVVDTVCDYRTNDIDYALNCYNDKNYTEAYPILLKLAMEGDPIAQNYLGEMYYYAYGVEQDYANAVRWYRLSAEQGNPYGQFSLAYMYRFGKGVKEDYAEALKWCRKSAEQGNEYAIDFLNNNLNQ